MRPYFNQLSLREKILLSAFIWVLIGIFATMALKQSGQHWKQWQSARNTKQVQALILAREANYDARFALITQRFDSQYTLDETELRNRLEAICKEVGVDYTLTSGTPKQEGNFSLFEVVVYLNRVEMPGLLAFYNGTLESAPYMRLDALTLSPGGNTPEMLSAKFVFKSFEMETQPTRF